MNVQLLRSMDSAAFLAWAEGREGRYELANGRINMMTGGSYGHVVVVRGLFKALDRHLDGSRWITLTNDFAVQIASNTVRYPDVVVDVRAKTGRNLKALSPVLIAEVLSPSSVATDLGDKAAEYLRLETVSAYLVLSQDEPKAWVGLREKDGFPPGPAVIAGAEAKIHIEALAIELSLAEIYADLPPPDEQA